MRKILITLLFVGFILSGTHWTAYADTSFAFLGAICTLLGWFDYVFVQKGKVALVWPLMLLFCLWIWISAVSLTAGSGYNEVYYILRYGSLVAVVWLFSQRDWKFDYSDLARSLAVAVWVLFALLMIAQCSDFKFGYADLNTNDRPSMTFGNPNYFAAFLICAIPFFGERSFYYLKKRQYLNINFYLCSIIASLIFLLLSGSRNGIFWGVLVLLVIALVGFRIYFGKFWSRWHLIVSVATIIGIFAWLVTDRFDSLERWASLFSGMDRSGLGRMEVWVATWEQIGSSPRHLFLGSGFGAMEVLGMTISSKRMGYKLDLTGFAHCHSEYLEIWLEGGLIGLVLFGFIFFAIIAALSRNIYLNKLKDDKGQCFALLISLLGIGAFSCFSVASRYYVTLWIVAIVIGLALRCYDPVALRGTVLKVFACLSASLLLFGHTLYAGRWFVSDVYLMQHRVGTAVDEGLLLKSIHYTPERAEPRYELIKYLANSSVADPNLAFENYSKLNEIIPNYKNVDQFYAYYLAKQQKFREAGDLASSLAEIRYYQIDYLCDALFYYSVAGERENFNKVLKHAVVRSIEAQSAGADNNLIVRELQNDFVEISYNVDGNTKKQQISIGAVSLAIPEAIRYNRPALKKFTYSLLCRIVEQFFPEIETPRFMDLVRGYKYDVEQKTIIKL